jgi:hypothetical protein
MLRRLALTLCAATGCYSGVSGFDPAAGGTDDTGGGGEEAETGAASEDDGSGGDDGEGEDEGDFGRSGLRRLTRAQLSHSIRDLLGPQVVVHSDIDPDLVAELFTTVGASQVSTSSLGVQRYEAAALDAVHQAFAVPETRAELVGCDPTLEDTCAATFLAALGRRAWRRPLAADELDRYVALAHDAAPDDPWLGLELATSGLLQSPSFLYIVEVGEPDPDAPERLRYTDWEMAGRLAAFVWASAPDDALLDAAAAGLLQTPEGLATQVDRMLADPRAATALAGFFEELLHLEMADHMVKDPELYPEASPTLFAAMRGEVERMIAKLVLEDDADLRDLFDTRQTFVNAELAALYGLPAPDPAATDAEGFAPATIPDGWERAGIFGSAVFLAGNATVGRTSPTRRGLFLQLRMRCSPLPPPPDDVDTELPPQGEGEHVTMRERLEEHRNNPVCAGCHDKVDPIGLSLERFDGLGRHRDDDLGLPLDVSGALDGQAYEGLPGLAALLRDDPSTMRCMARQAYRFATGHRDGAREIDIISGLTAELAASGHHFSGLVRALVLTDGFRYLGDAE